MQDFRAIHRSGYARREADFYPTPAWVTKALLKHVKLRGPVWEPCCGDGAIARTLGERSYEVVATDAADYGFGTSGVDFFDCRDMPRGCRSLVTNPVEGDHRFRWMTTTCSGRWRPGQQGCGRA